MKKKILMVVMLLALVLCMSGCSSEADKLVGTWEGSINMQGILEDAFEVEGIAEYIELDEFFITMTMKFNADGTYSAGITESSAQEAMDQIFALAKESMIAILEDQIAEIGIEMSVEDVLALSGLTMESLEEELEAAFEEQDLVGELVSQSSMEGKYDAEKGKLYLSAGPEYEVDKNVYEVYELDGDSLTLLESIGEAEVNGLSMEEAYPVVFTRKK